MFHIWKDSEKEVVEIRKKKVNRYWTAEEVERLTLLIKNGLSDSEIAVDLKRTVFSVSSKIKGMGLKRE